MSAIMPEKDFDILLKILEQLTHLLQEETKLLEYHKIKEFEILAEQKIELIEALTFFQKKWGSFSKLTIENMTPEKKATYFALKEQFEEAFEKNMITIQAAEKVSQVLAKSLHEAALAQQKHESPIGYGIKNGQFLTQDKITTSKTAVPLKLNMCF